MLNPVEEAKFAELRGRCRDLGVPCPPEIHIGLKVHDKDGNLTFENIQRGHSWTRNFYNYLFMTTADAPGAGSENFGVGYLSGKGPSGTLYGITYCAARSGASTESLILAGGIHNNSTTTDYGIVVGTSATAENPDLFTLGTLILTGATSGKLAYQAMTYPVTAYTAGTKTWKNTIKRVMNNNSGGSITVAETGLYSSIRFADSSAYNYMVERSVLSPTVAVGNGAQLTVTYEISMDFSAID